MYGKVIETRFTDDVCRLATLLGQCGFQTNAHALNAPACDGRSVLALERCVKPHGVYTNTTMQCQAIPSHSVICSFLFINKTNDL